MCVGRIRRLVARKATGANHFLSANPELGPTDHDRLSPFGVEALYRSETVTSHPRPRTPPLDNGGAPAVVDIVTLCLSLLQDLEFFLYSSTRDNGLVEVLLGRHAVEWY